MGLCISALLSTFYLIEKVYALFCGRRCFKNRFFWVFGALGLALLAAQIEPVKAWDLYRHYEELERMRAGGWQYAAESGRYRLYPVINLLFFLVSRTSWNGLLVFIAVGTELLLFEKIIAFYREKGLTEQTCSLCFFLYIVLCNMVLAISGIRNVLAVTLTQYGLWRYCVMRKQKRYLLLCAAAVLIHPAAIFADILFVVSYFPLPMPAAVFSLALLPILVKYSGLLLLIQNPFVRLAAGTFQLYLQNGGVLDMRVRVLSFALMIFSLLALKNAGKRMGKTRLFRYAAVYLFGTMGMVTNAILYARMLYGLSMVCVAALCEGELHCLKNRQTAETQNYRLYKVYCLIYSAGMVAFQDYELLRAILRL